MKRAKLAAIALGGAGVLAPFAPGCSLGLDASLIGAGTGDAAAVQDTGAPPTQDAPSSDGDAAADVAGACTKDSDCTSADACRVGTCNAGTCAYAVCPTTAPCQGSYCDPFSHVCTTAAAYGFHAGAAAVSLGPVGCNGNPQACLAAVYPFVFVGTANGVLAYPVTDPANPSPIPVPLSGVPFLPNQIIASGSRVYFVGSRAGVGPTYKLAVAWLDVPSDPSAKTLEATSVFETDSEPVSTGATAGLAGSLYLLDYDPTNAFPMATLTAPLVDGATIAFYPSPGVPTGAFPVAASGSRVVLARWSDDVVAPSVWFSFEYDAATTNAQNGGETNVTGSFGPSDSQAMFAEGDDGSVLWNARIPTTDDAGDGVVEASRLGWLVASGASLSFSGSTSLDVVQYTPPAPAGTVVAGPVAWVDAKTALVLAADNADLAETTVQLATNTPSPALVASRSYTMGAQVDAVGAAASGGFAYVLAADSTSSCTLHMFAPSCP